MILTDYFVTYYYYHTRVLFQRETIKYIAILSNLCFWAEMMLWIHTLVCLIIAFRQSSVISIYLDHFLLHISIPF